MIETVILSYLSDLCPAYMEVPETPPDTFIVVEKTGSSRENRITSSTFAIQSYAPSLYEAAQLNEQVKERMDSATELNEVCASRLNSDYAYTDTSTKRYRYQAVYNIVHY